MSKVCGRTLWAWESLCDAGLMLEDDFGTLEAVTEGGLEIALHYLLDMENPS